MFPHTYTQDDPLCFVGKTVVITGGSGGIGLGIADAFAACGATVHITGTKPVAAGYPELAERRLRYHQLDVTDDSSVATLLPDLTELDVLVCCAATVAYHREEYRLAAFRRVIDVNLTGVMASCLRFHDQLSRRQGAIVVIGSIASFRATPGQPAYSASKGALRTLITSLAAAWASEDVRVNGIAPGFVATKLTAATTGNERALGESLRKIPLGRWGTPAEMGSAALFLASPMASYITSQMLQVDGGIALR